LSIILFSVSVNYDKLTPTIIPPNFTQSSTKFHKLTQHPRSPPTLPTSPPSCLFNKYEYLPYYSAAHEH
jgi:hypothetical protein